MGGADRNRTDDLLLAKQVRWVFVTWTVEKKAKEMLAHITTRKN